MNYKLKKECRLCGSSLIVVVGDFGSTPIANNFVKEKVPQESFPLQMMLCKDCGNVQLHHVIKSNLLFDNYVYKTGSSPGLVKHFKSMSQLLVKDLSLEAEDLVIDVGANDGTFLLFMQESGMRVLGVDPGGLDSTVPIIKDYFSKDLAKEIKKTHGQAKLITATNVFAHIDDLNSITDGVVELLAEDGTFVIEVQYLVDMLDNDLFDMTYCLPPETLIIGCNKRIKDCVKGDTTFDANGEQCVINNILVREFNGELIKIKATYLEEIKCTPDHEFLVVNKSVFRTPSGQTRRKSKKQLDREKNIEPILKMAKDIERCDYLCIPKIKNSLQNYILDLSEFNKFGSNWRRGLINVELNNDLAWLIGLYVAEGNTTSLSSIQFSLNKTEIPTIVKEIERIVGNLGYSTNVIMQEKYADTNGIMAMVYCAALGRAFKKWCGKGAKNKHIPDFILCANEDIKKSFLRGLFAGDGTFNDGGDNFVSLHTSSYVLAKQTQLLLASLDIMAGVSYFDECVSHKINGQEIIAGESWFVRSRKAACRRLFDKSFVSKRPSNNYLFLNNFILVPVNKVNKEKYKGDVYSIETNSNTFIVSNAVTHNCEHMNYHSIAPLVRYFESKQLCVTNVEKIKTHGGSIRVYVSKNKIAQNPIVKQLLQVETDKGLKLEETYKKFLNRIELKGAEIRGFLKGLQTSKQEVWGYGAPAKLTTMSFFWKINEFISKVCDDNPLKQNSYTPGAHIPVVPSSELYKHLPHYCYIFAWNEAESIIKNNEQYLKMGGKFIIPLPEFKIVGLESI